MKIHVLFGGSPQLFETGEELYNAYAGLTCPRPETELIMKPLKVGLTELEHYDYTYFQLLNAQQASEGLLQAEKEGADAAIMCCFFDPGLRNARGVCRIPVLGLAESSMLFASLMGRKFAIVVPRPGQIPVEEDLLVLYRLRSLAIDHMPIRSLRNHLSAGIERQPDETDMEVAVEDFLNVSRACMEDGAEVIIPGCSMLSMALALANVTQVDDAVVVDPLTSAVKLAEAMVDLGQGGRPWISRNLMYKSPAEEDVAQIRKMFGLT